MKGRLFTRKAKTLILFFLFLWLLVFGRLFYLQVLRTEEISKKTQEKQIRLLPIESRRGNILDRKGRILATDLKMFTLYARKSEIRNPRAIAKKLAYHSLGSEERLFELLQDDAEFIRIARGISDSAVDKIKVDGVYAVKEWYRFYPSGLIGRTVLGSLDWKRCGI